MSSTSLSVRRDMGTRAVANRPGFLAALRLEGIKLRAQLRTKALLLGAVIVPVAVVIVVHSQPRPPKDTLFGRFATENGFAMALLVLGFASQWLLPLLTAIVAGDIFASEDQHGTWKTVLTRSVSRSALFGPRRRWPSSSRSSRSCCSQPRRSPPACSSWGTNP